MGQLYIISDGYYREEYPMHTNLDIEKFYGVQKIELNTTVYDLLGDNLTTYLYEHIAPANSASLETWELAFLKKMQLLIVFYVAKGLETFNADSSNDNQVSAIRSKIKFLEKRLKEYIEDTDELVVIQDGDTELNRTDYQSFPTYFYR